MHTRNNPRTLPCYSDTNLTDIKILQYDLQHGLMHGKKHCSMKICTDIPL